MRKILLLLVAFCTINVAFAQFYVSASGGYSIGSAGILTGTSLNDAQTKATNHYGSYGEGFNTQLRGGYFFNKMFGLELSLGYLGGSDQNISNYLKNDDGDIKEFTNGNAHAEAFGINLALAYNFNENFYGKIGVVSKLGGKTEATFTRTTPTPFGPIVAEGVNDYHGRPPLGFTAAFGYKYKLTDNLNLFAELEYLGINVTRDTSEFAELTITTPNVPGDVFYPGSPAVPSNTWNLGDAPYLWLSEVPGLPQETIVPIYAPSEIDYVDSLPEPNNDPSKSLSSVAPYSSFGINIGITYTFSKKEAK
ncbi:Opacity protein [Lutibacter agarilyticus]|uniref:Opacity protein n=1 Tax=Lutibacter agarilyticus TaxID=1109740 RepID=A0A238XBX3_9FLAO|nr:outer membrane beta-barrel protein [Lutibacter agarilyticus]SNR56536.1 Opacity protein [Lutibacter agarilyticus]